MLHRAAWYACWIVVPMVGLFAIVSTYRDIRTYSGDDLRNRVVGARVMLAGYDPYTFVWQSDLPVELLDPVYDPKAHRLTISPPTLLLYAPSAAYPYYTQRTISFVFEWLAMIASLVLLVSTLPETRQRVLFLLGAMLCVIATDIWRMHVERGQVYVFQLLALSAAIAWSRRGQVDSIPAGIALGLLALIRPNLLVLAPALLVLRQWRSASSLVATVSVGVAGTALMLPASSWQSYLAVGDQYYRSIQEYDALPDLPRPAYEGPVEGVQFGTSLPDIESSSFAKWYQTTGSRIALPTIDLALTSKIVLAGIAALLLALLWQRRGDPVAGFTLMIVLSLITEFFLPHRWAYADVMLLAPVALMLPELLREGRTNRQTLAVLTLGLLLGLFGQHVFGLYAATVLRAWLVMAGLTALAISSNSDATPGNGSRLNRA